MYIPTTITQIFDKKLFLRVLITTFVIGLLAHGYCFFNVMYTHDGLDAIVSNHANGQMAIKVTAGRITQPLYYAFRGYLAAYYLLGVLSLLWLACANYCILSIFNLKEKWSSILLCGLFATNVSFTLTCASYIHECDSYAFGFFLSSLAVLLSQKSHHLRWISPICLAAAIGLYQAFISVAITLYMILLIEQLFKGKMYKDVFSLAKQYIIIGVTALIIYLFASKLVWYCVPDIASQPGTSLQATLNSSSILYELFDVKAYIRFFYRFFVPETYHIAIVSMVNIILFLFVIVGIIRTGIRYSISNVSWILLAFLSLVLSIGMNLSEFLSVNNGHSVMTYAYILIYILPIIVLRSLSVSTSVEKWKSGLTLMMGMVIVSNAIYANHIYLHKHLTYQNGLSEITRILSAIEGTEGYKMNETELVFVGDPALSATNVQRLGFEHVQGVGIFPNTIGCMGNKTRQIAIETLLGYPILFASSKEVLRYEQMDEVKQMPAFPHVGYCQMVEGKIVVKIAQ